MVYMYSEEVVVTMVRIVLSTSSSVPMYEQVKSQIRAAIHSGDLGVGEKLPSLRQLAADLRVSVITVTRAYNDLVAEGLVTNEHGRGFVVREVDEQQAQAALRARLDEAVDDVTTAARHARFSLTDLQQLIETRWRTRP